MLRGRTVVVGVAGGIAAYKACELVRWLTQRGAAVVVVMTPAATQFVTALTFQALSGNPVVQDLWGDQQPEFKLPRVALRRMGAPDEELAPLQNAAMPVRPLVDPVFPDVLLEDGARPEVPGWDLTAIWTPGHSPGHLCFYESALDLMLSGDHVLPRITPNIPFHPQAGANPLGDFLASLDKLEPYVVDEVLPAHEYRFDDLQRRLEELRQHHRERFGEIIAILREGPTTGWDIASRLKWSRPWDDIAGFMRRAAVGEAVSHLRALEIDGVVEVEDGEPALWSLTEAAARA